MSRSFGLALFVVALTLGVSTIVLPNIGEALRLSDLSPTVLLVSDNEADSAVAQAVKNVRDVDVVTTPWGVFDENVVSQVRSLNPDRIYIIGGHKAVLVEYDDALASFNRIRLSGKDRYHTAALTYEQFRGDFRGRGIVIAHGHDPEGIEIANNQAMINGSALLYVRPDEVPTEVEPLLAELLEEASESEAPSPFDLVLSEDDETVESQLLSSGSGNIRIVGVRRVVVSTSCGNTTGMVFALYNESNTQEMVDNAVQIPNTDIRIGLKGLTQGPSGTFGIIEGGSLTNQIIRENFELSQDLELLEDIYVFPQAVNYERGYVKLTLIKRQQNGEETCDIREDNPPEARGGSGTNWDNPPGPQDGTEVNDPMSIINGRYAIANKNGELIPLLTVTTMDANTQQDVLTVQVELGHGNKWFYDWISSSFDGQGSFKDGFVYFADSDFNVEVIGEFRDAYISEVTFPDFEGTSNDLGFITVKIVPGEIRYISGGGKNLRGDVTQSLTKWQRSNFRFELGELPTNRVSKVESFTWKQTFTELTGSSNGAPRQREVLVPNIRLIISMADIEPWQDWHKDLVIGGNYEYGELNGSIEFFAPDLTEKLAAVGFFNSGIISLEIATSEANTEEFERFTVEFYVDDMKFK
jgi:hypothetical protein